MVFDISRVNAPDISKLWDEAREEALDAIGQEAVNTLQGGSSVWPVKTGASKAGFDYEVSNGIVRLTNSEDYAPFVEERSGAGEATLASAQDDLRKAAADQITEEFK